jgi:nucleotide-binding universal stress UspA family protein
MDYTSKSVRRQLKERLKREERRDEGRKAGRVKAVIRSGNPAEEILAYAGKNEISLIAMATHGHTGITRWVLGSVADRVLQAAEAPVLLLRAQRPLGPDICRGAFARILVPLDGSALGEASLPYVEGIASKTGAEIILFQAIERARDLMATYWQAPEYSPPDEMQRQMRSLESEIERRFAFVETAARQYLEGRAANMGGLKVQCLVSPGKPAQTIIESAAQYDADLIAMSTHGRSGFGRWLMGNVADRVIHSSDRPVLLIRAKE